METRTHVTKATNRTTIPTGPMQAQRNASLTAHRSDARSLQATPWIDARAPATVPGAAYNFGNILLCPRQDTIRARESSPRPGIMQLKLLVGRASDPLEQEAEHVADQMMRVPSRHHALSSAPEELSRECANGEKGTQVLHSKNALSAAASVEGVPAVVDSVLRAPGRPLATGDLEFFADRFGHNFEHVQIHSDRQAAESAYAVGARAYTVGSHVVFGAQEYAPSTTAGRRLLAHELTHVAQQNASLRANRVHPSRDGRTGSRCLPTIAEASHPALMRQEIPGVVPDTESTKLPDQPASSHGAKSPGARQPKPAHRPAERIPTATSASDGALKAISHAKDMHDQQDPAIWFDSWGNDLRDNNLNGAIDEKAEQGIPDGTHYARTFDAKVCSDPSDTVDHCSPKDQTTIKVQYKVCIDVPIESYKAAGANISTSRWIPTFFGEMSKKPNWTVWKRPAAPSELLAGDIVAADNAAHQHAGIVDAGLINNVINLPGPTSSRRFHLFNPSGKNDMVSVPRILFESFLSIDWIARLNK